MSYNINDHIGNATGEQGDADDFMRVEYVDPKEDECQECKCSFGIHLVTCSHFTPHR